MSIGSILPSVSVVVNTYNRAASLHQTLQAMRRQNYSNFEVIVVNGPSTDETLDVCVHMPPRFGSEVVHSGICQSRGT
jgi:glycosyltransferase involved in cell wall biosynthesis